MGITSPISTSSLVTTTRSINNSINCRFCSKVAEAASLLYPLAEGFH